MIRKSNVRMTLCLSALSLLLAFIWGNSLLPGYLSGAFSDWFKGILKCIFPFLFSGTPGASDGGLLRKLAHFTEFAALGACLCWLYGMISTTQTRQMVLSLICGILAASVDETIQRFVPGRHGCLTDVCIDTAGVTAGILLFTVAYLIFKNKNQYLEESK